MNRLITILITSGLALAVTPLPVLAGDAAAGKEKAVICQACHGVDGHGIDPTYPILAGQYQSYLAHTLRGYRSGQRTNVIMASFAATLSDQDIEDLAAWYASQEGLQNLSIK